MLQPVGMRPQEKKIAKIGMRPQANKMARCREQQGEENGEDARPGVKNPSMLKISKIPRGTAGPTLNELRQRKENIMQAKNNLDEKKMWLVGTIDSKQEQLDWEMADVVEAIAVKTKWFVEKGLLTVKEEGEEEVDNVEEEADYDAEEEEEEEDNVKEEEEDKESWDSKSKKRHHLVPTQPPFPPPTQADEESAEEESAVPGLKPTQADEEFAEEKSSEEMCGREERDEENKQDADERFAWIWFEQNGVDSGIPKEYTPCVYFFKAKNSCTINKCQFSHNKIFRDEPFAAMLKDITWESVRPPPRQTRKKHR